AASPAGSAGAYAWTRVRTQTGPAKVFIPTCAEAVALRESWVGVRGQRVVGMSPVSSEGVYRKAGSHEHETILD
ncbi:hypothetical protein ACV357_35465, partial [Pseudomonas aeruginosa]